MTESEQIAGLEKTVSDLIDKLAAKEQAITCPLLEKLREQNRALEELHAEDIAENLSELNK